MTKTQKQAKHLGMEHKVFLQRKIQLLQQIINLEMDHSHDNAQKRNLVSET